MRRTEILIIFTFLITILLVSNAFAFSLPKLFSKKSQSVSITTNSFSTNITNFTNLLDAPNSYAAAGGYCVKVNAGATGLEFTACATGSSYNETYAKYSYNHTNIIETLYGKWFYNMSDGTGGSSSYNATYAIWAYNQTTPFTTWLSSFLYNYNQTIPAMAYADSIAAGNLSFNQSLTDSLYAEKKWGYNQTYSGSTYNSTYATWAYNQSDSIWHYNMSDGVGYGNSSWNQSLANTLYAGIQWGYNFTSTIAYNQNHTNIIETLYGKWFYNMSDGNSGGSSYNATYAGTTSAWNGNSTALLACINNASYLSTYNATYALWAYNQTYSGSTYNATYAIWAYNQSGIAPYNYSTATYNMYGANWYNHTLITYNSYNSAWSSTYNATYATWAYNMSDGVGSGNSSWNQSLADTLYSPIKWNYNQTTATYNMYGANWYNHTIEANKSIVAQFGKWFYNMSDGNSGAINIFDQNLNTTNNVTFANVSISNGGKLSISHSITGTLTYIELLNSGAFAAANPCITWKNTAGTVTTAQICSLPGTSYLASQFTLEVANSTKSLNTIMTATRSGINISTGLDLCIAGGGNCLSKLGSTYNATYDKWAYNMSDGNTGVSNIFDQELNTTKDVRFNSVNVTGNITANGKICLNPTCGSYIFNNGTGVWIV